MTPHRVVSNSKINNNSAGVSYNDFLVKVPNSFLPLIEVLATFKAHENIVVWDISTAYKHYFVTSSNETISMKVGEAMEGWYVQKG